MTTLTLTLNTPTELRLAADFLCDLATEREPATAENSTNKSCLAFAKETSSGVTPGAGADEPLMLDEAAFLKDENASAVSAAEPQKRKRRTKAEMAADEAAAKSALSQAETVTTAKPADPNKIVLRDSSGAPKAAFEDPALASQALQEIFAEAPSLASLENLLSVNADAVSAVGKTHSDDIIVAYGVRQSELKVSKEGNERTDAKEGNERTDADEVAATPHVDPYVVTRIDGKKAGFLHAPMAAECLGNLVKAAPNDVVVKALRDLNADLLASLGDEAGSVTRAIDAMLKPVLVKIGDEYVVPTDPEVLAKELLQMLKAYFVLPDVGFVKGTEFLKANAGADRFTKVPPEKYADLYRLVKPLLAV